MNRKLILLGSFVAFGLLGATNANASYMSTCSTLISAWEKCQESGQSCVAENKAIVEQCKCHRLKQGSWKLVTAAVGKDGVCNATYPYDDTPPPPEHKIKTEGNTGVGSPDIEGNKGKDRGGPKEGNTGRGNH